MELIIVSEEMRGFFWPVLFENTWPLTYKLLKTGAGKPASKAGFLSKFAHFPLNISYCSNSIIDTIFQSGTNNVICSLNTGDSLTLAALVFW